MANQSKYVSTGKPKVGGAVFKAPAGTTLPTDAKSTLGSGFVAMGYISEDGVSNTLGWDSEVIKDWGGSPVITYEDNKNDEFKMTFLESLNPAVLKAVHGDGNVTGTDAETTGGLTVTVTGDEHEAAVWVIDMILKGNILKRVVIPAGTISALEEVVYKKNEPIGYGVTITATLDSSENFHYEYFEKQAGGSD